MKKLFTSILITLLSVNFYAQVIFEKGYYINNKNKKVDCLIKNKEWRENPLGFEYKLSKEGEVKKMDLNSVQEFRIYNSSKYIRNTVNIDKSRSDINTISTDINPVYEKQKLFLKVLIEGGANLYVYKKGNLVRYFFSKGSSQIEQLVFKHYKIDKAKIAKNTKFRGQLWKHLKCKELSPNNFRNIDYKKEDLIKLFLKYNTCKKSDIINYEVSRKEKDLFNLTFRPRLNSSSLSVNHFSSKSKDADFEKEITLGMGVEAEFIMPFLKNKWAIIIEPTYKYFKSEKELALTNAKVDYKSIEVSLGVRHYLFLNEDSKFFINGSFNYDYVMNSALTYDTNGFIQVRDIHNSPNLAIGIGYKFKDRVSFEFRYHSNREILSNENDWGSDFRNISIILGHSFF